MKTYSETFNHCIDIHAHTTIIDKNDFQSIQKDALEHAIKIISNNEEYGLTTIDIISALQKEIDQL